MTMMMLMNNFTCLPFQRPHSVFIVHAERDNEMVKADLVDPLKNLEYSVLWNYNAFPPGDNITGEA